jgi:hypothetical protein
MKFLIVYVLIAVGTGSGYDKIYREHCPNDKFTFGPILAGMVWPIFAGLAISKITSGETSVSDVECGNKF